MKKHFFLQTIVNRTSPAMEIRRADNMKDRKLEKAGEPVVVVNFLISNTPQAVNALGAIGVIHIDNGNEIGVAVSGYLMESRAI